jgi:hypothetical protein
MRDYFAVSLLRFAFVAVSETGAVFPAVGAVLVKLPPDNTTAYDTPVLAFVPFGKCAVAVFVTVG